VNDVQARPRADATSALVRLGLGDLTNRAGRWDRIGWSRRSSRFHRSLEGLCWNRWGNPCSFDL